MDVSRTQAWEDRSAWPMFLLSLVFFAATLWLFADETLRAEWKALLSLVIVVLWVLFIADYVVRFALSTDRRRFLRRRWFEALSLFVPYLRPFVIIVYIWRLPWFRAEAARQRIRMVITVVSFSLLFVYTASSLVWLVEHRDPHANIVNLGDAIWWGFTTISTVGYGDFVPVTVAGRVIAVGLMMGGLIVLGVTSATIISLLNDQIRGIGSRPESKTDVPLTDAEQPPPPA